MRQFPFMFFGTMTFLFSIWYIATEGDRDRLTGILIVGLAGLFLSLISATIHSYEETLKERRVHRLPRQPAAIKYVG